MSALDNLQKRIDFYGGNHIENRMIEGKRRSLKMALGRSYQSATIVLPDEKGEFNREFKALINPDKLKPDYDNKIVSMLYEDIQLNVERKGTTKMGEIPLGVKSGDVFYWKESNSYWIIYLQYKEELAYFRGEIRECKKFVEINGHKYWVYYRGPVETTIPWNQKKKKEWNTLNYSAVIYITKNDETLDYFHRFSKIKIDGNPWEVKAVDSSSGEGIIEVQLKEDFKNTIQDESDEWKAEVEKNKTENVPQPETPRILGDSIVYPYDKKTYKIINIDTDNGEWSIDNTKKARILRFNSQYIEIEIISGKSGSFNLKYNTLQGDEIVLPIEIKSL